MKKNIVFFALVILGLASCSRQEVSYFDNFPEGADPVEIGTKITYRFLAQGHSQYGSPLRINEPRTQITYPDVCTWLGGLWFAKECGNAELTTVDRTLRAFVYYRSISSTETEPC